MLVEGPVTAIVPATSANLGPGFDCFGLGLALHDQLVAEAREEPGWAVSVEGEGAGALPLDGTHLVARAMRRGFDEMGVAVPGITLACANAIPHGRGLGSSAAAIVAGLALARGLVVGGDRLWDDAALLDVASTMEGHPDNVAAALLGGLTIAVVDSAADGATGSDTVHATVVRRTPHPSIGAVIAVPVVPVATRAARDLLPGDVAYADAAFNVGRAAIAVHALTEDPSLLMVATEDRLHQRQRATAYPGSLALVQRLRSEGIPAVISGAGPTVLALASDAVAPADAVLGAVTAAAPADWAVTTVGLDRDGSRVGSG